MTIEDEKQSPYSPGPVSFREVLLRIIYYPDHVDADGNLRPEAIPTQDLRDRGFSVYRKLYVKREKMTRVIDNYISKDMQCGCRGISPVLCGTVRGIEDQELNKAFVVLDDANTIDDEAHAAIKYSKKYGKATQKGLRNKLKNHFKAIVNTEIIYEELDAIKRV